MFTVWSDIDGAVEKEMKWIHIERQVTKVKYFEYKHGQNEMFLCRVFKKINSENSINNVSSVVHELE